MNEILNHRRVAVVSCRPGTGKHRVLNFSFPVSPRMLATDYFTAWQRKRMNVAEVTKYRTIIAVYGRRSGGPARNNRVMAMLHVVD